MLATSKSIRVIVLLLSFHLFTTLTINAQSIIQSTGFPAEQNKRFDALNGLADGQTFKATSTGNITTIAIKMNGSNGYTGTLQMWLAADPGDGNKIGGTPYQTAGITASNQAGVVTFNMTTPFPVTNGTLYRMEFDPAGAGVASFDASDTGTYADGIGTDNGNYDTFDNRDLNFSITISAPVASIVVPTFSQWSLIVFGLLIVNLGLFWMYRLKITNH